MFKEVLKCLKCYIAYLIIFEMSTLGDTAGRLQVEVMRESQRMSIKDWCQADVSGRTFGRKTWQNVSDRTSRLSVYYAMLVYIDHGTMEPGSQETITGRDPNLSLYQAGVPPDGRFLAMASGIVGGTTGQNQIVNCSGMPLCEFVRTGSLDIPGLCRKKMSKNSWLIT